MSLTAPRFAFSPAAHVADIPPYVFWELEQRKEARRQAGQSLIDLGIGSPDQPVPQVVVEAIRGAAERPELSRYPAFRGHPELLDAFTAYMHHRHGVALDPTQHLMTVSGSKEGLAELVLALCEPGDVVLVPEVYYPVYVRATQLARAEPVLVPFASDGTLDLDAIAPSALSRARMLIANYPCNPTTAVIETPEMERLVAFAQRHDLLLVSDLAYAELAFDGYRPPSALSVPGALSCTVELHSASKSFNMASFRVGLVAGNADVIRVLDAYRTNTGYGSSVLPQLAAASAFTHADTIVPPIVAEYTARRDALVQAFRAHGWPVSSPRATMYLWLPVPEGFDDWGWVEHCMDSAGVVVTPGHVFGAAGSGKFRVSLVQPAAVLTTAAGALVRAAK